MAGEQHLEMTYFQYSKENDLPVYVRADLSQFTSGMRTFLESMGFQELNDEEVSSWEEEARDSRLLTISRASAMVARQIELMRPADRYGQESLVPKEGYKVYRYRGVGMMIVSLAAKEWELGCYEDFGNAEDLTPYRVMMNRFLGWALAGEGLVGFWGVPVDEGVVVLNQTQSQGEAVFVDVYQKRLFSIEGVRDIRSGLQVMRLDSTLKGRQITMKSDELGSFLTRQCTYLSERGLTVPVRQMIQAVTKMSLGVVFPKESFKPRTDLSL